MAVPVARMHLKVAHAALPALLPTPPRCKMLPLLSTPPPCAAAILQAKPLAAKPSRADADERWDAHKANPPCPASSASSSSGARHGSPPRKNASSPPPKPGRTDTVERWDAHKKPPSPAASSSSSSGTSSLASSSKCRPISRATTAERWDAHKERRPPQADQRLVDGESSSTGTGFVVAAPESRMLPMPTAFLVPVA